MDIETGQIIDINIEKEMKSLIRLFHERYSKQACQMLEMV